MRNLFIIGLIVLGIGVSSHAGQVGAEYVLTPGMIACSSKSYIKSMGKYIKTNDVKAAKILVDLGACVVVENKGLFVLKQNDGDYAKITPKGASDDYAIWTFQAALKRK